MGQWFDDDDDDDDDVLQCFGWGDAMRNTSLDYSCLGGILAAANLTHFSRLDVYR